MKESTVLDGLIDTAAHAAIPTDRRIYGVVLAQVVDNVDLNGLGRVQIHLPFLPEIDPWARVATLMAGMSEVGTRYGAYFIPQPGDEVLVAFNHGDVNEPYIIGSLWNSVDRPPTLVPTDAISKRIIRTPQGHEVEFDDVGQSITMTSSTKQKITLDPAKVEMTTAEGGTTFTLDTGGNVSIQSTHSITLKAPTITIEGSEVTVQGTTLTTIATTGFAGRCDIKATLVTINEPI
jgi:uncharacterized protein involved in type VI secretion and phage assembly